MDAGERTAAADSSSATYDGFISYSHAADDLLAPRLQAGLQRFAKPWWKRRAVRIFRDEASLAANPHLWASIAEALDDSGWFILLLSEDAAQSEWVNKEIEHWVANKNPTRILPVVTDGEFTWTDGDVAGTVVPPALHGVFSEEPRWVDLRFARGEELLDLKNPTFSAAIADIASAIRGIPKDELESEEVRQHRRTVRTAWAAGIALAVLTVAAVVAGIFAIGQRNDARDNAALAETNAAIAEQNAEEAAANAAEADDQRQLAEANAEAATRNATLAEARELAAAAINVLDVDPELSILLSLESIATIPTGEDRPIESLVALREAIHSTNLLNRFDVPGDERPASGALSPDGNRFAWLSEESVTVRLFDTATWEELWVYKDASSEDEPGDIFFSNDGSQLLFSLSDSDSEDEKPARIVVLDATRGAANREVRMSGCSQFLLGAQAPDGTSWPVVVNDGPECELDSEGWRLEFLDVNTFEPDRSFPTRGLANTIAWPAGPHPEATDDDSEEDEDDFFNRVATFPGHVFDVDTGERLSTLFFGWITGALYPDGFDAAGSVFGESTVFVWRSSEQPGDGVLDKLPLSLPALDLEYSDDGELLIAGSRGGGAVVWNTESGAVEHVIPKAGPVTVIEYDNQRAVLYYLDDAEISTWDLSGLSEGELNTATVDGAIQGNSLVSLGGQGAFLTFEDGETVVRTFDADTGRLTLPALQVDQWGRPAALPDGSIVGIVRSGPGEEDHETGPVVAWNPRNGSSREIVGCTALLPTTIFNLSGTVQRSDFSCSKTEAEFFAADSFFVGPSGDRLLVADIFNRLLVFDATTLEEVASYNLDPTGGSIAQYGGDWVLQGDLKTSFDDAVGPGGQITPANEFEVVALESGEVLRTIPGSIAALARDGRLLAVHDTPGHVSIYDTASWDLIAESAAGNSRIRGLEFSPDGSMLMTGGTDGFARIWDTVTGAEVDRIPIDAVSDGHWLDSSHLTIGTIDGLWTTIVLDVDELIELARSRLSRDLTAEDCAIYRIDPCPADDG